MPDLVVPTPAHHKRAVASWALWDWGSSAYSTIVVTFVFAPYLTKSVAGPDRVAGVSGATWLGISTAVAGVLIAVLAPVTGQRADAGGHRRRSLGIFSALTILSTLGLFFVRDAPAYLWLGLVLMAAGSVFMEFAYVSYNAMLHQISTPRPSAGSPGSAGAAATWAASWCCWPPSCCSSPPTSACSG